MTRAFHALKFGEKARTLGRVSYPGARLRWRLMGALLFAAISCKRLDVVRGEDFEGVILLDDDGGAPSEREVRAAERALPGFLRASPPYARGLADKLADYKRQYALTTRDGKRGIWMNFLCDPPPDAWQERAIRMKDGGECYFQVDYDIDTNSFSDLLVNGES